MQQFKFVRGIGKDYIERRAGPGKILKNIRGDDLRFSLRIDQRNVLIQKHDVVY